MDDALRAEIRDPLWLLSRQWQLSEFRGEDAGSPIRADLTVAEDALTRVDLRGGGRDAADPFDYEDEPLEAIVERETITENPPTRLRVEAGQQYLRLLQNVGLGEFTAEDFPEQLHMEIPDNALEAPDRRYVELVRGKALDGTAIAAAISDAIGNIDDVVDADTTIDSWSGVTESKLPIPDPISRTDTLDDCIEDYYGWYVALYDEPTPETGSAWDPTRLEYRFAVATGDADTETVFEAPEYTGGHLDRFVFSTVEDGDDVDDGNNGNDVNNGDDGNDGNAVVNSGEPSTLDPPAEGATNERNLTRMPTQVSFPGMPQPQWWTFEQGDIDLTDIAEEDANLSRLLLAEFGTQYGNDWFQFSLDTDVGTLSRISDLEVTDTFGVTDTAEPAIEDDWQLYMHELPDHDEAGLFLPPTLADSLTSDPVERVVFARDELANLVFSIERRVEGPTGRSIDRTEFHEPDLVVETVESAEDPSAEYVRLSNPGEDRLVVDGFEIVAEGDDWETTVATFGERTIGPNGTLDVYSGAAPEPNAVDGQAGDSVWAEADALAVRRDDGTLVHRHLLARPSDALADYRLSTAVPDYWFPFTTEWEPGVTAAEDTYRLERALLLDADSLGLPIEELPRPMGRILNPDEALLPAGEDTYQLFEEEVPRSGRQVDRVYQFARWTDGTGHLWSSRESRVGDSQLESGLAFDILDERDG